MRVKKRAAKILAAALILGMAALLVCQGFVRLRNESAKQEATLVMAVQDEPGRFVPAFVTRPEAIPWGEREYQKRGSGL